MHVKKVLPKIYKLNSDLDQNFRFYAQSIIMMCYSFILYLHDKEMNNPEQSTQKEHNSIKPNITFGLKIAFTKVRYGNSLP